MEGKVTTYLFYMGIIFALVTMLSGIFIFQKNSDKRTLDSLKVHCEAIVEDEKITEDFILPAKTVVMKKEGFKAENEYITSELLEENMPDIDKKGYAKGIIKTKSHDTDLAYYILPFSDNYICA